MVNCNGTKSKNWANYFLHKMRADFNLWNFNVKNFVQKLSLFKDCRKKCAYKK
jgi:hypothetical protein